MKKITTGSFKVKSGVFMCLTHTLSRWKHEARPKLQCPPSRLLMERPNVAGGRSPHRITPGRSAIGPASLTSPPRHGWTTVLPWQTSWTSSSRPLGGWAQPTAMLPAKGHAARRHAECRPASTALHTTPRAFRGPVDNSAYALHTSRTWH